MNLVINQTTIVTSEQGYETWQNDHDARPQPIFKRYYIKKIIEDVSFVPSVGEAIVEPMWDKVPHKVSIKYFDYDNNECIVTVTPFYIPVDSEWEKDFERIAQLHGWLIVSMTN